MRKIKFIGRSKRGRTKNAQPFIENLLDGLDLWPQLMPQLWPQMLRLGFLAQAGMGTTNFQGIRRTVNAKDTKVIAFASEGVASLKTFAIDSHISQSHTHTTA